jgi:hypothetical protein
MQNSWISPLLVFIPHVPLLFPLLESLLFTGYSTLKQVGTEVWNMEQKTLKLPIIFFEANLSDLFYLKYNVSPS